MHVTVSTRNLVSDEIFTLDNDDRFVVTGTERHQLTSLAKGKSTDSSRNQLRRSKITSKFILLEQQGNWLRLCNKAEGRPIHLIRCESNAQTYTWLASKGSISTIQNNISSIQRELTEEVLVQEIENSNRFASTRAVLFSTPSKMEATHFFHWIGSQLQDTDSARLVLQVDFQQWMNTMQFQQEEIYEKELAIVNSLVEFCKNQISSELLKSLLSNSTSDRGNVEIMLSWFENVIPSSPELSYEYLQLLNSLPNSRLWFATKQDNLSKMEKLLGTLGFIITSLSVEPGTHSDVFTVGNISYNKKDLIGRSSAHTNVFKGKFKGSQDCAVKVISYEFREPGREAEREIDALTKIAGHQNVLKYFGNESLNQVILLAIELCQCDLVKWIKEGGSCIGGHISKREVIIQAARGLKYLHEKKVVHRDLKPANILLKVNQRGKILAKIADYGISKAIVDGKDSVTLTESYGTPGWAAPEIIMYAQDLEEAQQSKIQLTKRKVVS